MSRFKKHLFGSHFANKFVAKITGQHSHYREYVWRDGKKEYSHVTGSIALPTFEHQGFLLVIGVERKENIMQCLDEFQSEDEYELIERAQEIQDEYGQGVIKNWWGDPTELMSLVNEKNIEGNPVMISSPIDADQTDCFQLYTARVRQSLSPKNKVLFLNNCNLMMNHILSFVKEKTAKNHNPAMYVAGSLVHTLLTVRPWEQAFEKFELIPSTTEDYAVYAQTKAMRDIEAELYGDVA